MVNSNVLVSVVMCIYNEPIEYLKLSIQSVLNQTHKNIEFLIVNDNPQNNEGHQLISSFKDSRIIYIRNKKNLGVTKSANIGLRKASGKYIARMDADDISLKNRIQLQVQQFNLDPNLYILGGRAYFIDSSGKRFGKIRKTKKYNELLIETLFETPIINPTVMFREEIFSRHREFYNESFKFAQDYELFSRLVPKFKTKNVSNILICYRRSENQISTKRIEEQTRFYALIVQNRFQDLGIYLGKKDLNLIRLLCRNINNEKLNKNQIVEIRELLTRIYDGLKNDHLYDKRFLSKFLTKKFSNLIFSYQGNSYSFLKEQYKLENILDVPYSFVVLRRIALAKKIFLKTQMV